MDSDDWLLVELEEDLSEVFDASHNAVMEWAAAATSAASSRSCISSNTGAMNATSSSTPFGLQSVSGGLG